MNKRRKREDANASTDENSFTASQATPVAARPAASLAARLLVALDHQHGTVSWIGAAEGLVAGAESLAAFLGRRPADLAGAGWLGALELANRDTVADEWRRALEGSDTITTQWRFVRSDGVITPLRVTLQPLAGEDGAAPLCLCIAQPALLAPPPPSTPDVALNRVETGRATTERHADELGATIESIESVVDGLIVYDASGHVGRINRALRALWFELGASDLDGLSLDAAPRATEGDAAGSGAEELRQALNAAWRRIMTGESLSGVNALDVTIRISEEKELELSISGGPVTGEHGKITGAVETVRDMTAQRQSDRERIRALSFVAHELRTPLTSIKLSLDVAIHRFAKHVPIEPPALAVALDGIRQIERMVEDLVDAARGDNQRVTLTRERCDMVNLCRLAVEEQASATGRLPRYAAPDGPLWVNVDRVRIRQVLSNLLSNALKYSPPDSPIDLQVMRRGDQVWTGVRDRGPGVPPEAQAKLFQAFYRAPGAQAHRGPGVGLGLGLFLCKRFVELHGGQIGFTTSARDGSLFWFTLPLVPEPCPEADSAAPEAAGGAEGA